MGGMDDNVAIQGEWVPPSPSPRTIFTSMLGEDVGSRTTTQSGSDNRTEELFLGPQEQRVSENSSGHLTESVSFAEQKLNSRAGLVERRAARSGFNAPRLNTESIRSGDLSLSSDIKSPYLTIPPGLSPTTLLESPVFLSNSLAQPSPTTGKFPFVTNGNNRSSMFMFEAIGKYEDKLMDDINTQSFAFKPRGETGSPFNFGSASEMAPATLPQQSFPNFEISVQSDITLQSHIKEPSKASNRDRNGLHPQADFSSYAENENGVNTITADQRPFDSIGTGAEHSPPLDEHPDEEVDQRGSGDSIVAGGCGAPSEDGYNWRKYGQKQVKGSEYPRSYYKCTHPNCQVKKKVERSHEGQITEIIYKGAHNHPKPSPNRRSVIGSSNPHVDMQLEVPEQAGPQNGENDMLWSSMPKGASDWRHDNLEVTSSALAGPEYVHQPASLQAQNGTPFESGDAVDVSSTFSNDEEEDDRGTHGSVTLGYEGEGDESESKRRKIEAYASEMSGASRAIREPRVVVQTTSEVDILDDGYRWRKYGQKVVKGNPNPRSYYKCTNAGCTVRKHVERASHDLKSVITTYEGKHNHDVPAARNSSHVNSGPSGSAAAQLSATTVQSHIHRPEPSQAHNGMARFERPPSLSSFSLSGRQQLGGLHHGFPYGMNQPGLANLNMAGMSHGQVKLPVLPMHPYLTQHRQMNEMGFVLPKGEPKVEPMSDAGLNLSNGSSVYQQMMSRLPLGPQI